MRDEQQRQAEFLFQLHQQIENLRLNGHVERRYGLVADQQVGFEHQRACDPDALALSARELVRIARERRRRQTHALDDAPHARIALSRVAYAVHPQHGGENLRDRAARIGRRIRILEHHLHLAAQRPQRALAQRDQVGSIAPDRAARHRRKPHDRARQRGFAAPRLADQPHRLAAGDLERDVVHRAQRRLRVPLRVFDAQCLNRQQRRRLPRGRLGRRGDRLRRRGYPAGRARHQREHRFAAARRIVPDLRQRRDAIVQIVRAIQRCAQQAARVRMPGPGENIGGARFLDLAPRQHHGHAVCVIGDHAEIVRDQQQRHR